MQIKIAKKAQEKNILTFCVYHNCISCSRIYRRYSDHNCSYIFYQITSKVSKGINLISKKKFSFNLPSNFVSTEYPSIGVKYHIYIIGGRNSGNYTSDCFRIDTLSEKLEKLPSMRIPKYCHCLVNLKDYIFAIGGYNSSNSLVDCEKYSVSQATWYHCNPLHCKRSSFGACSFLQRFIYAFAGYHDEPKRLNTIEKYDYSSGLWEEVKIKSNYKWIEHYACTACSVANEYMLIFGGYINNDNSKMCSRLVFKDGKEEIETLPDLPKGTYFTNVPTPSYNKKVFSVDFFNMIFIYDPKINKWTTDQAMDDIAKWYGINK